MAMTVINLQLPVFNGFALCTEVGGDMFFPEPCSQAAPQYKEMRKVCIRCEVNEECAEYAIQANEQEGMWGGLSPNERKEIRRLRGLL
jgi:WhiB family redox-sensing transcriptional regulator